MNKMEILYTNEILKEQRERLDNFLDAIFSGICKGSYQDTVDIENNINLIDNELEAREKENNLALHYEELELMLSRKGK